VPVLHEVRGFLTMIIYDNFLNNSFQINCDNKILEKKEKISSQQSLQNIKQ
jgi:hypothetical protein